MEFEKGKKQGREGIGGEMKCKKNCLTISTIKNNLKKKRKKICGMRKK